MATKDFKDILGQESPAPSNEQKLKVGRAIKKAKRPKGMSREVYNLFAHGPNEGELHTVNPIKGKSGYQIIRTNIAFRKTRRWNWKPFVNEARTDGVQFCHWEREDQKIGEPYVFAQFDKKKVSIVKFTDADFDRLLRPIAGKWTLEATRHLLEVCARFDLRWIIIFDRFDRKAHGPELTLEDLKEWYYKLSNAIKRDQTTDETPFFFDADHERKRKKQMEILWNRTEEEIKEEETLRNQIKQLESKRKEREKRAQELQRLINSSERSSISPETNGAIAAATTQHNRQNRRIQKNRSHQLTAQLFATENSTNLRFSEFRSAGPHLRSQEMKLPSNVGQKKLKAIEAAIDKWKLPVAPHAYEEVVRAFNEFRTKVVFAQELRNTLHSTEQDLASIQQKVRETSTSRA
ncbi:Myb-like domain-containing protein [Aphelenchoides besseyi]|nr:Myb-like domain-containing protein [Aphelenchoides besseyi]KAI6207563.1 Myb-like domain-containing protein [Aphelenchoides besseyi]